jgi:hypothetical protein
MMRIRIFAVFILLPMVASACGPQVAPQAKYASGSQTWIDAPLAGSHLPLAAVDIVAHAANPDGIVSFEINLNGQLLAKTVPDTASIDQTMMYTRYTWQPSAPGSYLIEVKAFDRKNQPGPPAQVTVEVGGPTPTEIQRPTSSPTPTNAPLTFTPNINAYCRPGPDQAFNPLEDLAMKGQSYPMDGRNWDGTWYRIMLKPNEGCWVLASVGTPSSDTSHLRVLAEIPTPTQGVDCSSFTDQTSCEAYNLSCEWKHTMAGPGVCVKK